MRQTMFLLGLIALSGLSLRAQESPETSDLSAVAASVDRDLRDALDELAALRERIAREKAPLAIRTETVASNLREARRKADLARTSKDAAEDAFTKSENDLKAWRDEKLYIESLFIDFRRTWESSKGIASVSRPEEPAPSAATGADFSLARLTLADLARGSELTSFPGEAVSPDGALLPGRFFKAGPVHWFLSDDKSLGGLAGEGADLRPRIVNNSVPLADLEAALSGNPVSLVFDPTMGSAVALSDSEKDLLTHVKQGGFWVIPILILAFIALAAALAKWLQLAKIREFSAATVQKVLTALNEGRPSEAAETAGTIRHPARRLLERGIELVAENPRASRDDLEEALFEKFLESTPLLQRGLPLIAIASATAPLLGLLGTVTGMMETFKLITIFGTGDAKSLASGISEALITTEFGLVVAIPALIVHSLLSRKVQGIKSVMEMTSLAFLNGIKTP